jgi:hypothetical protein
MKKFLLSLGLAGLSSLAFAADFSVATGATVQGLDLAQANFKTRWLVNPFADLSYNLKTDATSGKVGLYLDDATTLIQEDQDLNGQVTAQGAVSTVTGGATKFTLNSAYSRSVVKLEPYADLTSFGVAYRVSLPVFVGLDNSYDKGTTGSTSTTKAYDVASFAPKYRNAFNDTLTGSSESDTQKVLVTTYGKVGYKVSLGPVTVTPVLEYDLGLAPSVRLIDLRPWVSVAWGKAATLDAKVAYYTYAVADTRSGVTSALTAEPKVTVDFSDWGVKNLKATLDSYLYLSQTDVLKGDYLTPGVSYKWDSVTIDLTARIINLDDSFPGFANTAKKPGADLEIDPALKVTYAFGF